MTTPIKILGTGLTCIDIIHSGNELKIMNGGSCANVISVLSQIGFDCCVIREQYTDDFERVLSKTFSSLGVKEILYKEAFRNVPKVIELHSESDHRFFTCCPTCGTKILKIHLPSVSEVERISDKISEYTVFYSDRSSAGIRAIMDIIHQNNGLVIFEPNSSRALDSILETVKHADIVKFSRERFPISIADKIRTAHDCTKLIIYTTGKEGLLYSHIKADRTISEWITVQPVFDGPIIDSSGAGDWLTAGFISELLDGENNPKSDWYLDENSISDMLSQGMRYSQLCCAAIGAQGAFYSETSVRAFSELKKAFKDSPNAVLGKEMISHDGLCPMCLSSIS